MTPEVLLVWGLPVLGAAVLLLALLARRRELRRLAGGREERRQAVERGSASARLQYPEVDLARCIGCGICVAACPEEGVLDVLHGQAVVVHGARCVGHGRCADECPVGAIAVTLGDLSERRDIPALAPNLESPRAPGLFLAGEVTGFALIRTAIGHGTAVAAEVARRLEGARREPGLLDLVVVGAGPAGLACSLEARRRGLDFVTLEQGALGGTVAHYPRRKLVMTQPVELPLHGRLSRTTYSKEELMDLWQGVALREQLPVREGERLVGVTPREGGGYEVRTESGAYLARHVCLALGRRGTPRRLGVPGEDLPKVAYALLDAMSYRDRRILVVGGGDSAVEAALGLCEQPGNRVTLSYRRDAFTRLKARNERRLARAAEGGKLELLLRSQVVTISEEAVELVVSHQHLADRLVLPNDEVFVFAGGIPPFELLEGCGVSFDPADRPCEEVAVQRGSGWERAATVALALTALTLGYAGVLHDYYGVSLLARTAHRLHDVLRPAGTVGLAFGVLAVACIVLNLAYLLRRSPRVPFNLGAPKAWMTVHLVTGVVALLATLLHAGFVPRDTVGGHALWGLAVLVGTGAVGRYFYAFVPRAANGRELVLEEARLELARLSGRWSEGNRAFGERARRRIEGEVARPWAGGVWRRPLELLRSERRLGRVLDELAADGRAEGVPADELAEFERLARSAHRTSLMVNHYEDLRGLLASWRYLHRWVALLMVLLLVAHVVTAWRYADLGGGAP